MSEAKREVSDVPTMPSADDALTRLWGRADASHGRHAEAVAALRERKRSEREESRPRGRRRREPAQAVPDQVVSEQVECERCKQTVDYRTAEQVAIPSPGGEPVAHVLCARCADEVRRGLLRLLAGKAPVAAPTVDEHEELLTVPARVGWFVIRLGTYTVIALAVFALVTWISVR